MYDVIVLGQGLVGSLLSFRLQSAGIDHVVIDRGHHKASSFAAAGIINPITGRRFVRSWRIEQLGKELRIYVELAKAFDLPENAFISPLLVFRDLSSIKALNDWDLRRAEPENVKFMGAAIRKDIELPNSYLLPKHSDWAELGLDIKSSSLKDSKIIFPILVGPGHGYRVDLQHLLTQVRRQLKGKKMLIEKDVNIDDHFPIDGGYSIGGIEARNVIDCSGAQAIKTATWENLPWRGTKGEAARFSLAKAPREFTVKRNMFLCPVGSEHQVWLGGTNQDQYDDEYSSAFAKTRIREEASGFGVSLPKNTDFLSGIRPTVFDRRPLVGQHPWKPGLWICNGMGTKGASLAPYCSKLMVEILHGEPMRDSELDFTLRFD